MEVGKKIIKHGKDYITTKEEYGQHGLGLQNVKRIVCKYSGNIDILDTNDIFDVKIVLYTIVVKKTVWTYHTVFFEKIDF